MQIKCNFESFIRIDNINDHACAMCSLKRGPKITVSITYAISGPGEGLQGDHNDYDMLHFEKQVQIFRLKDL